MRNGPIRIASAAGFERTCGAQPQLARADAHHYSSGSPRADELIGRSPAMCRLRQQLGLLAPHSVTALLTGPSGAGKSHAARLLHDSSPRAARRFVAVACANASDALLADELYGPAAGGDSSADHASEGTLTAAHGGTLFFDDIAELSLIGQARLSELLHSRLYYPLGTTRSRFADVRVIAATQADLADLVRRRLFSAELFYRLKGFAVRVPPLTERTEDIPALVEHLCARACARHRLPPLGLSPWAVLEAQNAVWPGNVRELANAVEVAALLAASEGAPQIETAHLFPDREWAACGASRPSWDEATAAFQRHHLVCTLQEHDWSVAATALQLGLSRRRIHRLIDRFGLTRQ